VKSFVPDILVLVGLGLTTGGAWWIYPPLGLIVPGIALCCLGLYGAKQWAS